MADKQKQIVVDKGESLWADAWKRLKKNKLALASAGLVVVMAVAGYSAPLIAKYGTHFSLDEQHNHLAFQPPGTQDVSYDHPTYDGDKAWFAAMDLDGDGYLTCKRFPQKVLGLPGLKWMEREVPSLHTKVLADLDALDAQMPIKALIQAKTGTLRCPELETLDAAGKHLISLTVNFDVARGDDDPDPTRKQPDGYLTWKEFPKTDADLPLELQGLGLSGPDAFRNLDVNGDHVLSQWEITQRTRYMRFNWTLRQKLLDDFDADNDLRISAAEFPGAPELHTFILGTDGQGRDVLTRIFYGARISISIGLLATFVSFVIGVIYGSVSGFLGGRVDNIMMRIVDVLYGLPYLFIVILLIVIVGRSTVNLFIALGAIQWLSMARVVRGQVISLKTREFVEAARAIGVSKTGIIFRHLMRNTVGPVIVYSTLLVPAVILQEAFLSFLGLGVQPPDPSWGNMITEGASKFEQQTWLILWPGLALAATLFSMNFLGDGIRDAIDPQMQKN